MEKNLLLQSSSSFLKHTSKMDHRLSGIPMQNFAQPQSEVETPVVTMTNQFGLCYSRSIAPHRDTVPPQYHTVQPETSRVHAPTLDPNTMTPSALHMSHEYQSSSSHGVDDTSILPMNYAYQATSHNQANHHIPRRLYARPSQHLSGASQPLPQPEAVDGEP